jgi:hypothetical protein
MRDKTTTLCHRCEIRAQIMEGGASVPRYECGDRDNAIVSCYMFRPVIPPVLKMNKGERRPFPASAMISGRVTAARLPKNVKEAFLNRLVLSENQFVIYWEPTFCIPPKKTDGKKR